MSKGKRTDLKFVLPETDEGLSTVDGVLAFASNKWPLEVIKLILFRINSRFLMKFLISVSNV